MENWYLPITLLPGIALLILSTSNLMVAVSNEINDYVGSNSENYTIMARKMSQLKLLNTTLVLFYISVAFFAISGLLRGLNTALSFGEKVANYSSISGIVIFLLGIICLITYSYRAVNVHQDQFKIQHEPKAPSVEQ